jgi:hypothetical protein
MSKQEIVMKGEAKIVMPVISVGEAESKRMLARQHRDKHLNAKTGKTRSH